MPDPRPAQPAPRIRAPNALVPASLAHTEGISLCAQVDRHCLTSYATMEAFCDCDVTARTDYRGESCQRWGRQD